MGRVLALWMKGSFMLRPGSSTIFTTAPNWRMMVYSFCCVVTKHTPDSRIASTRTAAGRISFIFFFIRSHLPD